MFIVLNQLIITKDVGERKMRNELLISTEIHFRGWKYSLVHSSNCCTALWMHWLTANELTVYNNQIYITWNLPHHKKWEKDPNKYFSKDGLQMVSRHVTKYNFSEKVNINQNLELPVYAHWEGNN